MGIIKTNKIGYFNAYILNRIKNNKNFMTCITGQTGSGKTYAALKMGEILDPDFDITNVCFSQKEFMDLVDGVTKKLKRGAVILFDEIQVTIGALDYHSITAKEINYVLSTFRHKGYILIVTSPFFDFINKSARKLFHSRIETISIDFDKKTSLLKPFVSQTNQRTGDTYDKYLRVLVPGQGVLPVNRMELGLPSKKLIEDYEKKKTEFTDKLGEQIRERREATAAKKEAKPKEHKHQWQIRIRKGDKYCRICAKIEPLTLKEGLKEDKDRNNAAFA